MADDRWKTLDVWKNADALAFEIYKITKGFPREEQFGITSQLRRASLSIPANIVEGYSRKGDRELARFLNIGPGSLAETKYLLHFAKKLGYVAEDIYETLGEKGEILGKMLWRFYEKVSP